MASRFPDLRSALHPPKGLTGQDAIDAYKAKVAAEEVRDMLYPKDD